MRSRRTLALLAAVVAVLCAFTVAQGASAATGGCQLEGTVIDSTTVQPVNAADPPLTITTTRYNGDASHGLLAFEATPTECQTGVSSAGIEGVVGLTG